MKLISLTFKLSFGIGVVFVLMIFPLSAAVYYVSPSGNDGSAGTLNQPWRTVQKGIDSLLPGDQLQIRAGEYNEYLCVNHSGTAANPINISAFGQETVTVLGDLELGRGISHVRMAGIMLRGFSEWGIFLRGENENITFERMTVSGGETGIRLTYGYSGEPPLEGGVKGIRIQDSLIEKALYAGIDGTPGPCRNIEIINVEVRDCGLSWGAHWASDGIAVERGDNLRIEGCRVHDNAGDGIDLNSRDFNGRVQGIYVARNQVSRNHRTGIKLWGGGIIENNVVWGQGSTAVVIGDYPGEYKLINNTIALNMWDPVFSERNYALTAGYPDDSGHAAESDLTLVNNIFAFNTGPEVGSATGIYLGPGIDLAREEYNLFWSRSDGEIQAEFLGEDTWISRSDIESGTWARLTGKGRGDLCSDPVFAAEWPAADLHLEAGSPCIDRGTSVGAPAVDAACFIRPAGLGTDMGAYEMNSTPAPDCGSGTTKRSKKTRIRR